MGHGSMLFSLSVSIFAIVTTPPAKDRPRFSRRSSITCHSFTSFGFKNSSWSEMVYASRHAPGRTVVAFSGYFSEWQKQMRSSVTPVRMASTTRVPLQLAVASSIARFASSALMLGTGAATTAGVMNSWKYMAKDWRCVCDRASKSLM